MHLTASSGYAIHGLAYLAFKDADGAVFLSEISKHFNIPASYLAKVFQAMARAGLVHSYRGAKGGYKLALPADRISLRDVIDVFEGSRSASCVLLAAPCSLDSTCAVGHRLAKAQQAYLAELEAHCIADIADEFHRMAKGSKAP